jgi:hypothetical protein
MSATPDGPRAADAPPPPASARSTRPRGFLAHTSRAVYGTIVATAVLAGTNAIVEQWGAWHLLGTLSVTLVVLWFAEVYSGVLGDASPDSLGTRIARAADDHWGVLESGVPLGIPLLLGGLGVFAVTTALWITFIVAVVALAVWGGIAAWQRSGSWARTIGAGVLSSFIGAIIIILKAGH